MSGWRSQLYRKHGEKNAINSEIINNAVAIGDAIVAANRDCPPIFTLKHLAHLADVDYSMLRVLVARKLADPYRTFRIRKSRKANEPRRYRTICVPDPELMRTQRWIARNVLNNSRPHSASFAYANGSKIIKAAEMHCSCRWLIKLDVRNFFESISEIAVYRVFVELKYQPLIAFEMARLCTRVDTLADHRFGKRWNSVNFPRVTIPAYSDTRVGHLPQGAPTSPMLANLAARKLDQEIAQIAANHDLVYTRYADDIALSTSKASVSRREAVRPVGEIYAAMRRSGLSPNLTKTQVIPPGARKVILGLLVDGPKPRLSREFKATLRQHIYYLTRPVGPNEHARNRGFESSVGLRNHVRGLINFASQIEPILGGKYASEFESINWPI